MKFQIVVYDPIFHHRTIEVTVGLCHLIRLRVAGYIDAYYKGAQLYSIVRCEKCQLLFLSKATSNMPCPACEGC